MVKKLKSATDQVPLGSGKWDEELLEYWRASGLSANDLWMAELKMYLFGRKRAYGYLDSEAASMTSGCVQIAMF